MKINEYLMKLPIVEQINWVSRYVIIHGLIYYHYNDNVVSDKEYDMYSYYLADLINKHPDEAKKSYYYYVTYDFDGSTGFHLKDRLTEDDREYLKKMALQVLNLYKQEKRSKQR